MKTFLVLLASLTASTPSVGQLIYNNLNNINDEGNIPFNDVSDQEIKYPSLTNEKLYEESMNDEDLSTNENGYGKGRKPLIKNSFYINDDYGASLDNKLESSNPEVNDIKLEANFSLNTNDTSGVTKLFMSDRVTRGLYQVSYKDGKQVFDFVEGTKDKFYSVGVIENRSNFSTISSNIGVFDSKDNIYRRYIVGMGCDNTPWKYDDGDNNNLNYIIFDSETNKLTELNLKDIIEDLIPDKTKEEPKIKTIFSPISKENKCEIFFAIEYTIDSVGTRKSVVIKADLSKLTNLDEKELKSFGEINLNNKQDIKYSLVSTNPTVGRIHQAAFIQVNDFLVLAFLSDSGYVMLNSSDNFQTRKYLTNLDENEFVGNISVTQHNYKKLENNSDNQDYILVSTTSIGVNEDYFGSLFYIDVNELKKADVQYAKANIITRTRARNKKELEFNIYGCEAVEYQKTSRIISYYDDLNKDYVISWTTNLGVYSYRYENPIKFGKSTGHVDRNILLRTSTTTNNEEYNLQFEIVPNTLNYTNGELIFLTRKCSSKNTIYKENQAPENSSKSFANYSFSKLYKKYDISKIKQAPEVINFKLSGDQNKLSKSEKLNLLTQEIANNYKNLPEQNDLDFGRLFSDSITKSQAEIKANSLKREEFSSEADYNNEKNAELNKYDYFLNVDDTNSEILFPNNKYGLLDNEGIVEVNGAQTWFSKFKNTKEQKVHVNYVSSYDLINVAKYFEEKYSNNVLDTYKTINDIVGHIYNEIEYKINSEIINDNSLKGLMQQQMQYWEINDWVGGQTNYPANKGWGFNDKNSTTFDESTNTYTSKLNSIYIKVGQRDSLTSYLKIGDGSVEDKNKYLVNWNNKLFIKLPTIIVNYEQNPFLNRNDYRDSSDKKGQLDLNKIVKAVQNNQFNGVGFSTDASTYNIEYILNSSNKFAPGFGFAVKEEQIKNKLKANDTTIEVYLYDRAFNNPVHNANNEILKEGNYRLVKVRILGLSGAETLPKWIIPTISVLSISIILILSTTIWIVLKKRNNKE
ncbi:hypothetical protein SGLAD_v1c05380 [Spiroplasma gladiatoris]|uniref:Uncharacterized protein n=1 Tax=Spiroplasma gladiatoris TaxID=2143 RepID=A0A4P7AHP1_9MOLU|nr:hypothetical protein [Spiroplasma gladiatoris]QBQ07737.1 hypothetical protein SGLAD_v1c05380 [Spiroplasma gladiatoris]